jgi:hypothetical protein
MANQPTVPSTAPQDVSPAAYFQSWAEADAPHGRIEDLEYRHRLERIEQVIQGCGYRTFLPHRDVNRWGERRLTAEPPRANIAETLPVSSISEEGEKGIQLEEQQTLRCRSGGFACRGTE